MTTEKVYSEVKGGEDEIVIEQVRMKKSLNLFNCVTILCSLTGHVSVFVAPTAILQYTGSVGLSIIIWILGGIVNLFLCLCFTELATMFPKAGGPYAWIRQVWGPLPGFMILWGYTVLITGPFWAFQANCASMYILQPLYVGCQPPDSAVKLLATWIIVTFVALNCVYVKFVTKVQSILSLTKLLALLMIIVCGCISVFTDGYENLLEPFEGAIDDPFVVAMSVFFSTFVFAGWQIISNLMEEVKDPGRDLPRAVNISFFIIILEFVLVNLAYYVVLSKQEILQSTTVAVLFFEQFYSPLKPVISLLVAVTAIGVLNASILGHSRLLFAGARSEQAPLFLSMISLKFFTPWPALLIIMIWSLIMLLSGSLFLLMEMITLFSILLSLTVVVTVLYLRWTTPNAKRPYKTCLFIPISQLLLVVMVLFLCVYQEPGTLGFGLAILAAGLPVYVIGVQWKTKPAIYTQFMNKLTVLIQKMLMVKKSE